MMFDQVFTAKKKKYLRGLALMLHCFFFIAEEVGISTKVHNIRKINSNQSLKRAFPSVFKVSLVSGLQTCYEQVETMSNLSDLTEIALSSTQWRIFVGAPQQVGRFEKANNALGHMHTYNSIIINMYILTYTHMYVVSRSFM